MRIRQFFSDREVNTGRQPEIDLSKAVVIFFLATIHAYVECSTDDQLWEGLPYFFDSVLGGPWAAPMFIFCMGLGLGYSRRNTPRDLFRRGLVIGGVGLGLNVCRFLLPSLAGYLITGDREMYMEPLACRVFGNDLLQFAALALLLMALLRRLDLSPRKIWFLSLGMSLLSMPLRGTYFDSAALNIFLGHFIGVDDGTEKVMSDFPLLVWFLMYASGYVFSGYYRRLKDKRGFYKWVSPPCLVLAIAVCAAEYRLEIGMMGGPGANVFYHMTTPEMFVCIAVQLGMFGLYDLIARHLGNGPKRAAEEISRNVTAVYFIQWTLVWWTVNVGLRILRGSKYLPSGQTLILGLVLSAVSVLLGVQWGRLRKRKTERAAQAR